MKKDIFEEYETDLKRASAQPVKPNYEITTQEELTALVEHEMPSNRFGGNMPQRYSEDVHSLNLVAVTGMTTERRKAEHLTKEADPMGVNEIFELSDQGYFMGDLNSDNNPDSILDGDMQSYIDTNH